MALSGTTKFTILALLAALVWAAADAAGLGMAKCAWPDYYYDENVENCAPCSEICDAMAKSGTEDQCKTQCTDYLVSKTCRWDQYFEEVMRSCAPCSELCSQLDTNECSRKCDKYLEGTTPPGNQLTSAPGHRHRKTDSPGDTSSSWLPGIVASVAVGVLAIMAISGLVLHYKRQSGNQQQTPDNTTGRERTGTPEGDTLLPMQTIPLAPPTQVSAEGEALADINLSDQRLTASAADDSPPASVELGMPECDPVAPSSAANWFVFRQQPY